MPVRFVCATERQVNDARYDQTATFSYVHAYVFIIKTFKIKKLKQEKREENKKRKIFFRRIKNVKRFTAIIIISLWK